MSKFKIILSITLLILIINSCIAASIKSVKGCENIFQNKHYNKIVNACINLSGDTNNILTYKAIAELLDKVSLKRIDKIFDFGDADPLYAKLAYNKKLYSNLEKYYLKKAYNSLKTNTDFKFAFIHLLYAKLAYINIVYFQYQEINIINSSILKKKDDFITNEYIPHLKIYLHKYPKDKEALYLMGKQGIQKIFPPKPEPMLLYNKVVNNELYNYLKRSASLGYLRAKMAMITVDNWQKYIAQLEIAGKSNNKEALYKLGMLHYNNYLETNFKNKNLLDEAIILFEKAQLLGHKAALLTLLSIYSRDKPNKQRYTKLLKLSVNKYKNGYLFLGNLYWCNGDKSKAEEMYVKEKNQGGLNATEANYALEDLTKLAKPYDGCLFK